MTVKLTAVWRAKRRELRKVSQHSQDLRKTCPARRIGDDSTDVRLADLNDAGRVLRKS
jgi:hypothetical protein